MLGLGTSISTSSPPENKYSIDLDGSSDYVTIDSLNASLSDDMAFSISIWFNGDSNSGGGTNILFSANDATSGNMIRIGVDNAGTLGVFYSDNGTSDHYNLGSTDLDDGAWHNIIITRPSGAGPQQAILYIDGGSAITTNLNDSDPTWNSVTRVSIGQEWDGATISDEYQGKIHEVAFWNVQLDDDSRTAVYNAGKSFDLTNNRGNYDNSSDLIGYWRMGGGSFDDKANGIIHDQNNPGFGSEILNQPILTGTNWANVNGTVSGGIGTVTVPADGTYSYFRNNSISYTEGATYKVTVTVKGTAGKDIRVRSEIGSNNGGLTTTSGRITLTGSLQTETFYFISNDQDDVLAIERHDEDEAYSFEIHSVSLKKLNGHPGITSGDVTFSSDTP